VSYLESSGLILSVVTPLVAVPLTMITFYLRSLREHQVSRHADLARKVDALDTAMAALRQSMTDFERDYTTKEEWLRECMWARSTLLQLSEKAIRLETKMQHHATGSAPESTSASTPSRMEK
jgi:hypothetical protein